MQDANTALWRTDVAGKLEGQGDSVRLLGAFGGWYAGEHGSEAGEELRDSCQYTMALIR